MSRIDWVLGDLRRLLERFRDARLEFPSLESQLVELPDNSHCWSIRKWQRVNCFATAREEGYQSGLGDPAVDFQFLRPAIVNLSRNWEAGWDLLLAVSRFGELAYSAVATLHLHGQYQSLAQAHWPVVSEKAWLGLLHRRFGKFSTLKFEFESTPIPFDREAIRVEQQLDPATIRFEAETSHLKDVFADSCRMLDGMISTLTSQTSDDDEIPLEAPCIAVCLHPPQVTIRGVTHQVTPNGALLVQALVKAKGDWVSGSSMEMRADRVRASLPDTVRELIESVPGKGCRLHRTLFSA